MKAQPDSVRFEKGQTKNYSLSRSSALMNAVRFIYGGIISLYVQGRKKEKTKYKGEFKRERVINKPILFKGT